MKGKSEINLQPELQSSSVKSIGLCGYTSPRVEVLEISVECGFAASQTGSGTSSFGQGSEVDW